MSENVIKKYLSKDEKIHNVSNVCRRLESHLRKVLNSESVRCDVSRSVDTPITLIALITASNQRAYLALTERRNRLLNPDFNARTSSGNVTDSSYGDSTVDKGRSLAPSRDPGEVVRVIRLKGRLRQGHRAG